MLPPVGGEATGTCGSQHGLSEPFENRGHFREAFAGIVHPRQYFFQLGDNPLLFGKRGKGEI
jgi:hypothetical protein